MKIKLDEQDLRLALDVWVDMNFNGFELKEVTIGEKAVSVVVERGEHKEAHPLEETAYTKPDLGTVQRGGKVL